MLPLDRNRSATPAIWSLKITRRCHSVRSLRSPDGLSFHWSLVARLKLTILPPFCVLRTSGSLPGRPIRITLPANCRVTWISYAGDEGGSICKLEGASETTEAVFASITHLRFDPRLPAAREITAYQKHRTKRLRRQQG